jgi:hypothetical protein
MCEHRNLIRACEHSHVLNNNGPVIPGHVIKSIFCLVNGEVRACPPIEQPDIETFPRKIFSKALLSGIGQKAEPRHGGARRKNDWALVATGNAINM